MIPASFNRLLQFEILVIGLLIIIFFKLFYKGNYVNIIALLIFVYIIISNYYKYRIEYNENINNIIKDKYKTLKNLYKEIQLNRYKKGKFPNNSGIKEFKKIDFLMYDIDVIMFLESIKILKDYNEIEYFNILTGFNNILKIVSQNEVFKERNNKTMNNIQYQIDILYDLREKILKNINNYIYVLPQSKETREYNKNIYIRAQELINKHINTILNYNENNIKNEKINTYTKFTNMYK